MAAGTLTVSVLLTLVDQLSGPLKGAEGKLKGLATGSAKWAAGLAAGSLATAGLSRASQGALGSLASTAAAIDEQRALLRSLPGVSDAAAAQMIQSARAWSLAHADSAESYLRTTYQMISAGLSGKQALVATEQALATAKATMGDGASVAALLAGAYNNMGDKTRDTATEMGRFADVLTTTQQLFQLSDMGQLAEGLKYAMGDAASARIPFEQLNAVIGQLNNAQLTGSMAGTAFSASMRQMDKAAAKLKFQVASTADGGVDYIATLENLRAKLGDVSKLTAEQRGALQDAFGDEGKRAIIPLLQQLDTLKTNLATVTASGGSTGRAQGVVEEGAGQQYQILQQSLADIRLEIGNALLPALKGLIGPLKEIGAAFGAFATAHPGLVKAGVALTAIAAVLSPLLGALAGGALAISLLVRAAPAVLKLGTALRVLGAVLVANPIGALIAVVTAAAWVFTHWEQTIQAASNAFGWLVEKLGFDPVAAVSASFQQLSAYLGTLAGQMMSEGAAIGAAIVEGIKSGLSRAWEGIKALASKLADSLPKWVREKLGIASPSRVFAAIGEQTMRGLDVGLQAGGRRALAGLSGLTAGMTLAAGVAAAPALAAAPGASGASVSMPISITINAPAGTDARALADLVRREVAGATREGSRRLAALYDRSDNL